MMDAPKIAAAMDRLRTVLREHPEVRQRTARFLAVDPDAATLEDLKDGGDNAEGEGPGSISDGALALAAGDAGEGGGIALEGGGGSGDGDAAECDLLGCSAVRLAPWPRGARAGVP